MGNFEYKPISTEEIGWYFAGWIEAYDSAFGYYKLNKQEKLERAKNSMDKIKNNGGNIDVLYNGDDKIGFIGYFFYEYVKTKVCHVEIVFVKLDRRKRGFGNALINHVKEIAYSNNCIFIEAYVGINNTDSKKLFDKEFFNPTGLMYAFPVDAYK